MGDWLDRPAALNWLVESFSVAMVRATVTAPQPNSNTITVETRFWVLPNCVETECDLFEDGENDLSSCNGMIHQSNMRD